MKRNLVTVGVAALILAGVVVLNQFEPARMTKERMKKAAEAEAFLEDANNLEEELRAKALKKAIEAEQATASSATPQEPFQVLFECSNGDFVVECFPEWAPLGAARFKSLVEAHFYDDNRFFRVVPQFMVQFGIPGDPRLTARWNRATIKDDPVMQTNTYGMVTFATSGKDTRTTQLFISLRDNAYLDDRGFSPIGRVVKGMEVVEVINGEYKESPNQKMLETQGNAYLDRAFPNLDYIVRASFVEEDSPAP